MTNLAQEEKAAREANVAQIDEQCLQLRRVARCLFGGLAVSFIALLAASIIGQRTAMLACAALLILSVAFLVRVKKRTSRLQSRRQEILNVEYAIRAQQEVVRRQREGLRPRNSRDVVVESAEWTKTDHVGTDWVEDELQRLLPGDVVLKWNIHIQRGLSVERNGKIVADRTLLYISWPRPSSPAAKRGAS